MELELTSEDLYANREALRTALAAIPPIPLEQFHMGSIIHQVPLAQEYGIRILESLGRSRDTILSVVTLKYKDVTYFNVYITDTGFTFTSWTYRDYLTYPIQVAVHNWFQATLFRKQRQVAKARMVLYKEELMAAAWHPKRVERLLAAGGFEALDD